MKQLLNLRRNKFSKIWLAIILGIVLMTSQIKVNAANLSTPKLHSFDENVNQIKGTATEKLINQQVQKRDFIGTVTLVKNGHLVYQQGFGYANRNKNLKNSGNTTFQIASIQKGVTAMLLKKAALANHFSLDAPLSKFYPQIKNANLVTLRDLLTMTSGILIQSLPRIKMSDQQFLDYTVKHTKILKSHVGNLQYQPVNFVLLAGIVQKETKEGYYQAFKKEIQEPLKLTNTYFYQEMKSHEYQQAQGYHFSRNNPYRIYSEPEYGYTDQLGTGNLYMSNGDLYQMLHAFLTAKLLTPEQMANLYSTGKTRSDYEAGLYPLNQKMPELMGKQYAGYHFHGAEFGFETVGDISKDGQTAVIFASNSANRPANNDYHLDVPVYKQLIDDNKIF